MNSQPCGQANFGSLHEGNSHRDRRHTPDRPLWGARRGARGDTASDYGHSNSGRSRIHRSNTTFLVVGPSGAVSFTKYMPAPTCPLRSSRPSQVTAHWPSGTLPLWSTRTRFPNTSNTSSRNSAPPDGTLYRIVASSVNGLGH